MNLPICCLLKSKWKNLVFATLGLINTTLVFSARTGKLKPSLRTLSDKQNDRKES